MTSKEIIAKNILYLRKKNLLTQEELAGKLNYSLQAVSKWERALSVPDVDTLVAISKLFNVDMNYLFTSHEYDENETKAIDELIKKKEIKFKIVLAITTIVIILLLLVSLFVSIFKALDMNIYPAFLIIIPLTPLCIVIIRSILGVRTKLDLILLSMCIWLSANSIYTFFNKEELAAVYSIAFVLQMLLIFIPYIFNRYKTKLYDTK